MNQKLPRPLRNALARQAGGEVHPSPDALTSFMERTLPLDERDLVTDHLALCADCREVVFLASSAAEDVIGDEKELVAAAAHPLAPSPVYANAHLQPAAQAETPRRRWAFGLSWAAAALALLLVAGALVRQRFGSENPASPSVASIARNSQTPGVAQPPAPAMPSATETLPKTASPTTTPPKTASPTRPGAAVAGALAQKGGEAFPSQPKMAAAPIAESAQTPANADGGLPVAAPAPATHNSFAENQADTMSQYSRAATLARPMTSARALNATRGQWRISDDGHLEHRVAADDWTPVPVNEATAFRVVSVVGNDVWAGGSGGALFRSNDSGQHWTRVPLVTSSGAETGTIISIQFEDSQRGIVLTAGGPRWTTSDGGATWSSQ